MDQGGVEIKYLLAVPPLPKDRMLYNVLTKLKPGRAFLEDSSMIMNYPPKHVDDGEHKYIDKSSGLEKPESYVWTKWEDILHKPSYIQVAMKSNMKLLQS